MARAEPTVASDADSGAESSRFASWREGASRRFQTFPFTSLQRYLLIGLVVGLYIAATGISAQRQLWNDELYTFYIAKAPSVRQLVQELSLDLNPPLEYLAVRASLGLFGDSPLAVRLPSMIGFFVGSVCLYQFVRRRLGEMYGLLGVLSFWATPFFLYASEARPYGLIVGWFGLAMLAWDQTSKPNRGRTSVLCLFGAVTGMMLSHIFSLLYIAPFCLAEAWKLYRTRRIDWGVWAALLLPTAIPLAFLKLMARFEASLFPTIFEASPRRLGAFYYHTLLPEAPAFALAAGVAFLAGFQSKEARKSGAAAMTIGEVLFTAVLLALPEIVVLVLMRTHGGFFPRYAILGGIGYALLMVFAIGRWTNVSRLAAAAACCVLFLYDLGAIKSAWDVKGRERGWPEKEAAMNRVRPELPLVIASGLTFMELGHYAMPATAQRMYYLTDRDLAIKYAHATMFQDLRNLQNYFPMRGTIEPYPQFVKEHRQFLVFGSVEYPEDWLLRCLYDQHATIQLAGNFGGPYKDYHLFEVTMAGKTSDSEDNR